VKFLLIKKKSTSDHGNCFILTLIYELNFQINPEDMGKLCIR